MFYTNVEGLIGLIGVTFTRILVWIVCVVLSYEFWIFYSPQSQLEEGDYTVIKLKHYYN